MTGHDDCTNGETIPIYLMLEQVRPNRHVRSTVLLVQVHSSPEPPIGAHLRQTMSGEMLQIPISQENDHVPQAIMCLLRRNGKMHVMP